jgi:hypothetical protein
MPAYAKNCAFFRALSILSMRIILFSSIGVARDRDALIKSAFTPRLRGRIYRRVGNDGREVRNRARAFFKRIRPGLRSVVLRRRRRKTRSNRPCSLHRDFLDNCCWFAPDGLVIVRKLFFTFQTRGPTGGFALKRSVCQYSGLPDGVLPEAFLRSSFRQYSVCITECALSNTCW